MFFLKTTITFLCYMQWRVFVFWFPSLLVFHFERSFLRGFGGTVIVWFLECLPGSVSAPSKPSCEDLLQTLDLSCFLILYSFPRYSSHCFSLLCFAEFSYFFFYMFCPYFLSPTLPIYTGLSMNRSKLNSWFYPVYPFLINLFSFCFLCQ